MAIKEIGLSLLLVSGSLYAGEFEELPPKQKKPNSWKANVFVGSAFLAVVAGIVVICLDGGTPNAAIESNNKAHGTCDCVRDCKIPIKNNDGVL